MTKEEREAVFNETASSGPARAPLAGYTPFIEHILQVKDLLLQLIHITGQSDPSKAPHHPRPTTAWEDLKDAVAAQEIMHNVHDKLFPNGG